MEQSSDAGPSTSGLCDQCHTGKPKYKCPGCQKRTCSLECVKAHKSATGCTGKRKHSEFVALKDFDEQQLLRDYRFLEDVQQHQQSAAKQPGAPQGAPSRGPARPQMLPKHLHMLQRSAHMRGVHLQFMHPGMSRRKANSTRWCNKNKCILWHTEWKVEPEGQVLAKPRVNEKHALMDVLQQLLGLPTTKPTTTNTVEASAQPASNTADAPHSQPVEQAAGGAAAVHDMQQKHVHSQPAEQPAGGAAAVHDMQQKHVHDVQNGPVQDMQRLDSVAAEAGAQAAACHEILTNVPAPHTPPSAQSDTVPSQPQDAHSTQQQQLADSAAGSKGEITDGIVQQQPDAQNGAQTPQTNAAQQHGASGAQQGPSRALQGPSDGADGVKSRCRALLQEGRLKVLMKAANTPANKPVHFNIDASRTLAQALSGKLIVEYPTFILIDTKDCESFTIVEAAAPPRAPPGPPPRGPARPPGPPAKGPQGTPQAAPQGAPQQGAGEQQDAGSAKAPSSVF